MNCIDLGLEECYWCWSLIESDATKKDRCYTNQLYLECERVPHENMKKYIISNIRYCDKEFSSRLRAVLLRKDKYYADLFDKLILLK